MATRYFAIDHPARRILIRRVDGGVTERFDQATSTWIPKVDLLRYFLDGEALGVRPIDDAERRELEQPATITHRLDGQPEPDYRSVRE